jgi:tetracycline 7-halogenase / FADH2 O2-dependent halogenase
MEGISEAVFVLFIVHLSRYCNMKRKNDFDVIILGSGIAGTTLASILAKHGFSVLLLEKGTHPRFAIGESMGVLTSMWMWINGEHFGVPEIKYLSNVDTMRQYVSPNCGVKRGLGFLYHQEGASQNPNEAHAIVAPALSFISESHLFRPDVDHYMVKTAINYGVVYRDLSEVMAIDFQEDSVKVRIQDGEEYSARFLVDGAGYRSPVARMFDLREKPTRLRTDSRGIFTHVKGLRPYDTCIHREDLPGLSCGWHEGTLHHVFDGGWMWIIPFDNHEKAESPLCSIGLMLDNRKFPKTDLSPEQEFQSIVSRFPSVANHFQGMEPVREWVSTDRIQYSSTSAVGHRYALLNHSYGFIDPLYSRGLISTFETVFFLGNRLLAALKDNDFSVDRFQAVDTVQASRIDNNDQILYNTFRSMSHFSLWNAITQLWLAKLVVDDIHLLDVCINYMSGKSSAFVDLNNEEPCPNAKGPFSQGLKNLFDGYEAILDRVDSGSLAAEEGANQMLSLLSQFELPKSVFSWGDPAARHIDLNAKPDLIKPLVFAAHQDAPQALQEGLFYTRPSLFNYEKSKNLVFS